MEITCKNEKVWGLDERSSAETYKKAYSKYSNFPYLLNLQLV